MKLYFYICGLWALFALTGCDKSADEENFPVGPEFSGGQEQAVPEGYFVASFSNRIPVLLSAEPMPEYSMFAISYINLRESS